MDFTCLLVDTQIYEVQVENLVKVSQLNLLRQTYKKYREHLTLKTREKGVLSQVDVACILLLSRSSMNKAHLCRGCKIQAKTVAKETHIRDSNLFFLCVEKLGSTHNQHHCFACVKF